MDCQDNISLINDSDEKSNLICVIDLENEISSESHADNFSREHDSTPEALSCKDILKENVENELSVNSDALDQRTLDGHEVKDIISDSISSSCTDTNVFTNVNIEISDKTLVKDDHIDQDVNVISNISEERDSADEDMDSEPNYSFPEINYEFITSPVMMTGSWTEYESSTINNFLKGCKWSPDGSCILTNSEDHILRVFDLPSYEYQDCLPEMDIALKIAEGDLIYDYCWFPNMTSLNPITCCLVSTCRDHPIHMWDAYTGELRCTYSAYNHLDEIVAAHCLTFDPYGNKLYCGFNKMIRIFDVERPGREFEERPTYRKKSGQSGIISCIAMCPHLDDTYAAGSYSKSIGLYSESSGQLCCLLQGQLGGVTHLSFSPDGTKLYSGGRKDPEILCWDIRNPGKVLYSLMRDVVTNQRIYFDVNVSGRYIVTGHQEGNITIWDTTVPPVDSEDGDPILIPVLDFAAHQDAVNGVSFHPSLPILTTTSGQRKYADVVSSSEDTSDDELLTNKNIVRENSLRMWWLGPVATVD